MNRILYSFIAILLVLGIFVCLFGATNLYSYQANLALIDDIFDFVGKYDYVLEKIFTIDIDADEIITVARLYYDNPVTKQTGCYIDFTVTPSRFVQPVELYCNDDTYSHVFRRFYSGKIAIYDLYDKSGNLIACSLGYEINSIQVQKSFYDTTVKYDYFYPGLYE